MERKRYFTIEQRNKMIKEQNKRIKIELVKENVYLKDLLMQQKEVLDKIKEEVEYWGYEEKYNDDKIFCKCMKKIHELLEEIE